MRHIAFLALAFICCYVRAEEHYLLAADTQVIEINRAGKVLAVWKHPGHGGIYDAASSSLKKSLAD
jgi:hypothetical protein